MTLYADVHLPLPLERGFTYIIPSALHQKTKIGSRVLVSFKQNTLTGFVVKLRKRRPEKDVQFKEIIGLLDETPVFSSSFLSFTQKLSKAFFSSWGEILQASLPPSLLLKPQIRASLTDRGEAALQGEDLPDGEKQVLSLLWGKEYSLLFLRKKLRRKGVSRILSRLEKKGLIKMKRIVRKSVFAKEQERPKGPTQLEMDFSMDEECFRLASSVVQKWKERPFSRFLLHGSGEKREAVYFYLIKKILEKRKRVLFLVPEISLTEDLINKFEKRLGRRVSCLHSRLTPRKKELEWRRIKAGEVDVVAGPRSVLLSPISDIGLIIVDEEQDESYSQKESPAYDARKGAWLRSKEENCSLIYGSAFPSVETFYRLKKKGEVLDLKSDLLWPSVEVLDGKRQRGLISPGITEAIGERLKNGETILIFVNRRGYASFLYCPECNHIPRCPDCEISLTYHKKDGNLVCHYCNYSIPKLSFCPACGARILSMRGIGIEAVEEELKKTFPGMRVMRFDTDVARTRKEQNRIIKLFHDGKISGLVGTQLLAHQVDLPSVSLAVIFYPEVNLSLSDFRASEKTFLSIIQIMRFVRDGEVFIQTAFPHHYAIRSAARGDYMSFYRREIKYRRLMGYPPFSSVAEVLFKGESLKALARKSRKFYSLIKSGTQEVEVLGPALASGPRFRKKGAIQIILKSKSRRRLDDILSGSLQMIRGRSSVFIYD